ncbi:MAG TPA: helix-turn-helix transcriptional regulator [Rhodospirillales bacterium]|nr:helix-turn-helix transcriptional regulator [Rhodospirillales bacterium]
MDEEGPDPIDRHVGTRIRGRRVGMRVSQTKLGQAIGVTFQQIQKYESGTNRVGASNLFKISQSLGVDVSFFFQGLAEEGGGGHGGAALGLADQPPASFYDNPMNSREAFELMHNYYRIVDPTVRKRLFQLVRTLAFSESPDVEAEPAGAAGGLQAENADGQ